MNHSLNIGPTLTWHGPLEDLHLTATYTKVFSCQNRQFAERLKILGDKLDSMFYADSHYTEACYIAD